MVDQCDGRCEHEVTDENATARFDYEQVVGVFQLLTDVRFKLLAFVPSISGAAAALLTATKITSGIQAALAAVGFLVTLGIVIYDQRNTQLYNNVIGRAEHLEDTLRLSIATGDQRGGLFASRTRKPRRLFWLIPMRHDRATALIYSVSLGAWAFAAFETISVACGVAVGVAVALAFDLELERHDKTFNRISAWWRYDRHRAPLNNTAERQAREQLVESTDRSMAELSPPETEALYDAAKALARQLRWKRRHGRPYPASPLNGEQEQRAREQLVGFAGRRITDLSPQEMQAMHAAARALARQLEWWRAVQKR
jgi:hypothetical protein